jgi:glycosyltransferase involved in cell wall biosynthesis
MNAVSDPAGMTSATRSLLYLLNVSNPDRLSADSGWIFADLLGAALVDAGAAVTVAAPAPAGGPRCGFVPVASPGSKYRARFGADVGQLASLIAGIRPDVVVANQVEAAPAVRAAILEAGSGALLAGYCHYLPFSPSQDGRVTPDPAMDDHGLGVPVLTAFAAGLAACDRVLVHSPIAAAWVASAAGHCGVTVAGKVRVVPAPRDERLVRDPDGAVPARHGPVVAVYNHRLYAHYGTARFVGLARRLAGDGLRIRVMDLLGDRSDQRRRLDATPDRFRAELAAIPGVEMASDGGDRARYQEALASARFGIAPFRPGCPWSMSVIDCQAMGLPVIAPRAGWFAGHVSEDLLFSTDEEASAISLRLASDQAFYRACAKSAYDSTSALRPSLVAGRYLEAVT